MGLVTEQRHLGWCEGELQPTLGMGSGDGASQEGGASAQRQPEGCFATHKAQGPKQIIGGGDAKVDVDACGHHTGAITAFDQIVIRIVGVRTFESTRVSQAQAASGKQGELARCQPLTQPASRADQGFPQGAVVGLWCRDVFEVRLRSPPAHGMPDRRPRRSLRQAGL